MWTISLTGRALGDLQALDARVAERVLRAINRFAETGHGDVRRLQGIDQEWRLRVGAWRVRFELERQSQIMHILRVLHRSRAYNS